MKPRIWACDCGGEGTSDQAVWRVDAKTGGLVFHCPSCDARVHLRSNDDGVVTVTAADFESSLEKYFDTIVVINLDRRTDRWEQAQAELARDGIKQYKRFSAITVPDTEGGGTAGCWKSHHAIWRAIAKGEYGDKVLVLEDDFQLLTHDLMVQAKYKPEQPEMQVFNSIPSTRRSFDPRRLSQLAVDLSDRFETMIQHVPDDWDIIYLGGGYSRPPVARVHRHVIHTAGMLCTHSCGFNRRSTKALVDLLDKENPNDGCPGAPDAVLNSLADRFRFYVLSPRLFVQRVSTSDLTGLNVGMPFSMIDATLELMV